MRYPYNLSQTEDGRWFCVAPDFPEVSELVVEDQDELYKLLPDMFSKVLEFDYRRKKRPYPMPSPLDEDGGAVYVPVHLQAKMLLWNKLLELDMTPARFARKVGCSSQEANRMVDILKPASAEKIEKALEVLGLGFKLELTER